MTVTVDVVSYYLLPGHYYYARGKLTRLCYCNYYSFFIIIIIQHRTPNYKDDYKLHDVCTLYYYIILHHGSRICIMIFVWILFLD